MVRVGLVRRVAAVLAAAVVAMATAAPAVGAPPAPSPMPADAPIAPSAAPSALSPAAPLRNGDYIPGHVLVRFAPGTVPSAKGTARRAAEAGLVRAFGLVRNLELLRTRLPVDVAIERLRTMPGVLYAEPDWVIHADLTPNDPLLGQLWGLDQASDADIDAEAAWDTSTGAGVVVAVVDSGMELDHPDLAANLWTNPGEVAGNGIDDDDDGYVDDVHGWDFIADDAVPADEFGHGTHVAGTIAAVGDNGIGVVGVAFDAQLMPLRVLNSTGFGSISGAVRALDYATRHGARVSNNSWVWAGGESQPLADAIAAAGDAGQVVVAAAGNDAQDNDVSPHWPANYDLPNLLTVAATTDADQLAGFSDVGARTVDLGAPGLAIRSTWPGGGYALLDGTSMAAPHVAGVAALVLAAHPGWTAAEVRERILRTARPIAALDGVTATGGVVNAAAAVATSPDLAPRIEITAPTKGASVLPGADVTFTATADDPEDGDLAASIAWRSSLQGPLGTGSSITVSDLEEGSHLVTATVVDTAGHAPLASIVVRVGPSVGPIEASPDLRTPAIAVTPAGEPAVAWVEHGVGTIVARETGGTWSPQVVSRAYLETWPDLGAAPDGTLHLLVQREWSSVGVFDDSGILSAVDDGSGWSTTRVTQSCTDDGQGCGEDWTPAFALDPSGRAHAAFVRAKGQSPGLYHAWEHADGSWSSERVLPIASGIGRPDLAVDADGAVHLSYARSDGTSAGVYHATDASGSWIVERLSTSVGAWAVSIAAGDGGRLDVAWATDSGLRQRTRSGGTWGAPVTVSAAPAMTVDLVRMGAALHLVAGLVDASHTAVGVAYGINMGTGWTLTTIASGQDMEPRLAVDAGGHAHVAYRHAWPASEIRYATDATGSWVTTAVRRGWSDEAPATAVDADGVAHVAFGRFGTDPGVYVGSDEGGSWSIGRLTEVPPDGGVGIAARPDGTLAVAWGEYVAADGTPLADRGVYVATGSPGAWTTVRIATETVTTGHVVAADADGHLHVAWSTVSAGGNERIAYATDASGSWVTSTVTPGPSDREPSIAVEATGAVHIAFAHGGGSSPISYATNRTGGWVVSTLTSGFRDSTPSIALDPAGLPRIAFARDGGGVRLLAFDGSAWSSTTLSANALDVSPVVAVDDAGHQHVLYARASYAYDVCVIPLCPAYPGMRYATDETGSWATQRVTDLGNDLPTAIVCGPDGSISGVYLSAGIGIGAVRLVRAPDPGPTALVVDAPDAAPRLTTVTLAAVLTSGALPVYGRTVTFTVDGDAVGTAKTDRAGVASLRHALVEALGSRSVGATFAGDRLHAGSSAVPTTIEVQDLPAPTATAPVVHLPTGIALTQGKATVRVTFGGSNAAAYRLERSIAGGPWAAIGAATASRTRDVLVLPSQTTRIRFRVVPLTAGGAAGATVAGSSFRVWTVAERPSSALTYTGSWPVSTGPAYFGGSARHASAATARVTFRFTGREVAWIAATGPTRGSARVYVDGRYAGTVSLRASSAAYRRLVFRRAFATSGTHTIQLRVVGNGRVDVDGFVVLG